MKRNISIALLVALFAFAAHSVYAQSATGNPEGVVDSVTCSAATGWSYDPTYTPPSVPGCTDPTATNYDPNATTNDGSCTYPPKTTTCVSRYRWVNVGSSGTIDQTQGCAAVGAVPALISQSPGSVNGICASGEDRPIAGYDVAQIVYGRGIWGGGGGKGGDFVMMQNNGYRCYNNGQKRDKDNTDIAVAYYCDFGSQYQASCPADFPPSTPTSGGGGCFTAPTLVTLADGNTKQVSDLVQGDVVRGEALNNKVIEVKHVLLGDRPLYSIDGAPAFVTAGHPFKTIDGWKSIDPAETKKEGVDLDVSRLSVGDKMITETGTETVTSIEPHSGDASLVLYNPVLDGDHTYYANGFLVHNKLSTGARTLLNLGPQKQTFFEALADLFKPFRPLVASAASSDSNAVLVYEGNIDTGTLLAAVPANQPRPDVNAVLGISGNHGFSWTIPQSLLDNNPHTLSFYGTNVDNIGKTSELLNSPQTITCAPPKRNAAPAAPTLSCPANGSYTNATLTVSAQSTDPDGDTIRYLYDWNNTGSIDQYVPSSGYVPSGTQQSATRSWSVAGQKTVAVSAQDSLGNTSSPSSCTFSVVNVPLAPVVSVSANPANLPVGGGSTSITWSTSGATSCTASGAWSGAKATSGSEAVSVTNDSTFTLTCTGPGGTGSGSVSVTVVPTPGAPSVSLSANPSNLPSGGGNTTVTWSSTNASSCSASGAWSGAKATSGSQSVTVTNSSTFDLSCTGAGGSNSASASVTVAPTIGAPTVTVSANPSNLPSSGGNVSISWNSNGANSCTASGAWSGSKATSGSQTIAVTSNSTFNLSCTGSGGTGSGSASVTVATGASFCSLNPTDPSCISSFCASNPTDPSCTTGGGVTGVGGPGGGTGGSGGSGGGTSSVNQPGFTISSVEGNVAPVRFLAQFSGASDSRRLQINPVNGFTSPITLTISGIQSKAGGAALPNGVSSTYSFDGKPFATTTSIMMIYNPAFGEYVAPSGSIGATLKASFNKPVTEAYNITVQGTGNGVTATYVLTVDPNAINPSFKEL